ncbi:Arm DNA-binding domain-containing protein [Salicibibacter cibarius]|uniref:Arm DNA-binding domain-containing protein n=1 Tax=Salicibibacter cibarius TaxID=2743000 RepID=UPI001FEA743A|nr:Arm DNA-binding domain-containing protein [Salicibibacter cibarius]
MASYRKRGKTWYYQIAYRNPVTGDREYITKGEFKRKKEAELAVADVEKTLDEDTYIKESDISFADFADE